MGLVSTQAGVLWPSLAAQFTCSGFGTPGVSTVTLDAAGEKAAYFGCVRWTDRGTHTIDTTGSSAIGWRSGTTTFANGGTTIDIGIQGISTSAGPAAQPDGVYVVQTTLTGGSGITTNAYNTTAMTTGTRTIADGDKVAIVWHMTARAGADSVTPSIFTSSVSQLFPTTNSDVGGAGWGTSGLGYPNVILVASDGTLGTIDFAPPAILSYNQTFNSSSGSDEYGIIFQLPWSGKIDAVWVHLGCVGATADGTITLYTTPLGTPAAVSGTSFTVYGEQTVQNTTSPRPAMFKLPGEVSVTKNTEYCLAIAATGAGNLSLNGFTMSNAAHRVLLDGGTTVSQGARADGSGSFASTNTRYPFMGVRYSSLHADSNSSYGFIS